MSWSVWDILITCYQHYNNMKTLKILLRDLHLANGGPTTYHLSFIKSFPVIFQDILNFNLTRFRHGGVNITGFQLVNHNSRTVKSFLGGWRNLSSTVWPGAGKDFVQVLCTRLSERQIALLHLANSFSWLLESGWCWGVDVQSTVILSEFKSQRTLLSSFGDIVAKLSH